ncbi:DUF47 domain-containing protein [Acetobacterium bakii]|uniref:Phosphate transport regulator n=1 Tax=Acetobacterium bakii TaxID=52689 RepID=A0A0L6U0A5_9FIRM|nr:DUF47 family protein [Acetobacterium bakii]KNZ41260.1 hypothetical protein AKG39_13175 [Acetobacterium bakii]
MAKKTKTKGYNYYKEFIIVSDLILDASHLLNEVLNDYDLSQLDEKLIELHKIERNADEQRYVMMNFLFSDFLPPIEREDIIALSCALDTIIDLIEDILIYMDMYQISAIAPEMLSFVELIEKSAAELHKAVKDLKNFKKPKALHEAIILINRYENLGDDLYTKSVKKLFIERKDPLDTVSLIRIYDYFEKSCDSFEDAADIISGIILKNS